MKKLMLIPLAAIVLSAFLSAANRLIIQQVDTSFYPEMKIFLSVLDTEGKPVLGLKTDDFQILENSTKVENFRAAGVFKNMEWLALSLVVDRSGSMAGESMTEAKKAAQDFLGNLGLGDRVALVTFNQKLELASDFIQEKDRVKEIIAGIEPGNDTALYDAIMFAIDGIKKQASPRKAVVVLTDGKDTASKAGIGECLAAAKASGIPVFMIGLGGKLNEEVLKNISMESGGSYFPAPQASDLLEIYRQISAQLENQYVLLYRSLALDAKGVGTLLVNLSRDGEIIHDRRYFSLVRDLPVKPGDMARPQASVAAVMNKKTATASEPSLFHAALFGLAGGIIGLLLAILLIALLKQVIAEKKALKTMIVLLLIILLALCGILVYFIKLGGSKL
jgi:VWFA-related protein